ncbi:MULTISPECIES: cation:proton antiporter [Rhizobium]|jgi:NhaP-type Na+/H+ or K+/H+ antiporter|uniref:Sodium:proton antiporter n=1 Tax=Rhizobium leguminosarum TaxID=384 RepID=A0ABD7PJR6_RHILE|nr:MULTISPECIES: cation:proton antiporter [Rhizobium]KPN22457.1 cation transporter [Rhizobium brockwellii]MDV4156659.1 cation:proton antiporter [Rhizobium brockwellii]NZD53210.1 cation:proton antiporter [Rhizobium leguminosarum]QIO54620.1 sodium:proton antiporter [Rhizobium leguminosarum bv. trifolii]QJX08483.1 sodium:proton antiporter [Rhizobium brockwellii]
MDLYIVTLTILGVVVLLTAWLPLMMRRLPLSLPIACLAIGALLAWSPFPLLPRFNPLENREFTERMTEIVVIVALMGAGLKLDRPIGWKRWMTTWRLLGIAMPLTIGALAFLGSWILGLGVASAVLLGACLAPTDPVLASDVQVGPPQTGEEDEVRFALTSEAGLNDGLSFPFVHLAIALALAAKEGTLLLQHWAFLDVFWRLAAGGVVGWALGKAFGFLSFRMRGSSLAKTQDGFVALGMTFTTYGLTQLVGGYGFVAVFLAAVAFRASERHHDFHEQLHDFAEQIERLLMMVLLVCLGSIAASGQLLEGIDWRVAVVAFLAIVFVRPIIGWLSLIGSGHPPGESLIIAVFGIRGLGSIYYLAYATGQAEFERVETVWTTVLLIVLTSIVVHGIAVTPAMRWIDGRRSRARRKQTAHAVH